MNHHLLPSSEILQLLNSSSNGLSRLDAESRLDQYGRNILIEKKKKSALLLLWHQFKDVMIFILIIAAVVSFFIGETMDAIVILTIVIINAVIGFIQEYRAEKALAALKKMSAAHATVRRNGTVSHIPAELIVPGDIILLEAGNIVPADLRLLSVHSLKVEEAALTGESHPVLKQTKELSELNLPLGDRSNMAFKSTLVSYGRGEGIVVQTGMDTEVGKIASMLQGSEPQTPLQKRLTDFSKKLSIIVIFICILLYVLGRIQNEDPVTMMLTAISLAVAAIPEALPAVVTIALALGANRMIKLNALIRKLPAVETLGSVTYVCSDKTGTITENKMSVQDYWVNDEIEALEGFSKTQTLLLAIELNHDVVLDDQGKLNGDPTEIALVEFERSEKDTSAEWKKKYTRIEELPFDSERKRMTTINSFNGKYILICKGGAEAIADICNEDVREVITKRTGDFAERGYRVLAYAVQIIDLLPEEVSIKTIETDMIFLGLVALMDPPRAEVFTAVSNCYSAGIIPVMITGDHPLTARAIAMETGIIRSNNDQLLTGVDLSKLSENEFAEKVESIKVYARVSPEQKLNIVDMLQQKKHFVAMTGDGVNDAPALTKANIGIAMGISGTDVAKEASDMILLDDNFATIIKAVKEGRRIFDNIRKFVKYVMTCNSGEIWTLLLAPILGLPIPILPIHILWINLVTDGLPGLAMTAEPPEDNILSRPPRKHDESIFSHGIGFHIFWVGLLMGIISISTEKIALNIDSSKMQTMVFTVLSLSQMGHALAIRSEIKSLFQQGVFGNKKLIIAVLLTLTLQLALIYVPTLNEVFRTEPLLFNELLICIALSSLVFWAVELEKLLKRMRLK